MSINERRKQSHLDNWGVDLSDESLCPAPGCGSNDWVNQGPNGFECADCGRSIPDERVRFFDQRGDSE